MIYTLALIWLGKHLTAAFVNAFLSHAKFWSINAVLADDNTLQHTCVELATRALSVGIEIEAV